MNREEFELRTKEIIQEILDNFQVYTDKIQVKGSKISPKIIVVVDSEVSVDVATLSRISREITNSETMNLLIPNGFELEVSSPGLDKPIYQRWQFLKHVGRDLSVYHTDEQYNNPINGKLLEISEESITLEVGKEQLVIAFEDLNYAKVKLKW
jgi:ribosome maturation factor RimP